MPSQALFSTLEATAPCRLELIGRPLVGGMGSGVLRLTVALDRRVFCRVEPLDGGVEIHSKDTGERVVAEDVSSITAGAAGRVARMLAAASVHSGLRVVTQVRIPEDAGLGTSGALLVAVAAALGKGAAGALRLPIPADLHLDSEFAESDRHAALFGGAHVLRGQAGSTRVERVASDPARIEECLLLVDPGPASAGLAAPMPADGGEAAARVAEALVAGAYADVAAALVQIHAGRFESASPEVRRLVEEIALAGGAAWPCGRLVAAWAAPGEHAPGPREAVATAVKQAGMRSFPARVDLRGLEVE